MFRGDCKCFLFMSYLLLVSCVNDNIMLRDYFTHKRASRVVGFSCGSLENDLKFAKVFNDIYVPASMLNFEFAFGSSKHNLRRLLHNDYHSLGVYVDARCNWNHTVIYSEATKYLMYGEMHKWLILGRNLNDTVRLLRDDSFSVMTDVTIAVPSLTGYEFYDVYNPCKERGGSLNVTALGYWTEKSGVAIKLKQLKLQRRSNLHGMKLRVGILLSSHNMSTEDIIMDQSLKAKYGRSQFLHTLLSHMADFLNFTIEIVEVNPRKRQDNTAPIFFAFQAKEIDISASPIVMKADKLTMGDIIGPVWPMRTCFLFRTISSATMKTKQFLRPLNVKVWYLMFCMMVIAASVLVILLRLEGIRSWSEGCNISILFTIGALSQQGSVFVPVHYAGRIAFLQIMLFSLLMLNYYSASIVSDRLKNVSKKMNDSLITLANSNMKVAAEPTPYIHSFLQSSEKEVRYFTEKRWERVPESKRYLPLAEGLNRVAKGALAYHTSIDSAYPYIQRNFDARMICELTEIHLFRAVLALWAGHRSPFTPLLRIGLIKMYDMGIRKRQLKRWSARKPFCPKNILIAEPLSIEEAAPAFAFLSISAALSLLICMTENFVHWLWPNWLRRDDERSSSTASSGERWRSAQRNLHLSALMRRTSVARSGILPE